MNYYENYWDRNVTDWDLGNVSPEEKKLFDELLLRDKVCLDYGCGPALRYGKSIQEKGVDYNGYDISRSAVEQATAANIKVALMDSEGRTPMSDESADVAICLEVLEHLMEPGIALAEIYRCLKKGGNLLVSVPNAARIGNRVEFLLTGFYPPGGGPNTSRKAPWRDAHIRFYSPAILKRLAQSVGFECMELRGEKFSLANLPYVYRTPRLRKAMTVISSPFGFLGKICPSLFAGRIFLILRKPSD